MKEKTPLGDAELTVQFQESDKTSATFTQDNIQVGASIKVVGKIGGSAIDATADAVIHAALTKKVTSNQLLSYSPEYLMMFPGLTNTILATYDINAKIDQLNNLKIEGLPEMAVTILKNLLLAQKFEKTLDIPQFCIADEVCFNSFNAIVREGFIEADANVEFRPLRVEFQ